MSTTPNTPVPRRRIRIITANLWHGLDHTRPFVMFPVENPMQRWLRSQAQRASLKELLAPSTSEETLEIFLLQEVNPVSRRSAEIAKELGLQQVGFPVNVGVRAGRLSYPLFLEDGLSIFWRGGLTDQRSDSRILSGHAYEAKVPLFGTPLAMQFAERRGALLITGTWGGKTFTFVTLHLHNGPSGRDRVTARRCQEMDMLMEWLDPHIASSDAVFIGGDFNCEHGDAELSPIKAAGFEEILPPLGEPIVTWDPQDNPHVKASLARLTDPLEREWDSRRHQLDHIFVRAKGKAWGKREDSRPPWTFRIERIMDKPKFGVMPSDHFGLLAEIGWTVTG